MKMKNLISLSLIAVLFLALYSCSKTEENVPLNQQTIEINLDNFVRPASLINQEIPFNLTDAEGESLNDIATFFVNDTAIDGSVFTSSEEGDFEVYATYIDGGTEVTTDVKNFSVIIPKRKVVLEDYTGTWCGFCPAVAGAIEEAHDITDDLAIVAIHETANSSPDPMHFEDMPIFRDAFFSPGAGLPQARIDRTIVWNNPYEIDDIIAAAGENTTTAISINSVDQDGTLIVEVNVVSQDGLQSGDKLVVYLLESGILYDQTNYFDADTTSPYFGMGDPIVDFEHNDVLRLAISEVLGDPVEAVGALQEYTKTYNVTIPSDYVLDNLHFVAMLVSEDNTARNAQIADLYTYKQYE